MLAAMSETPKPVYDAKGRRRSPATLPGFRRGVEPGNKGEKYESAVFEPDEVLRLLAAIDGNPSVRIRDRAMFAFLWRTGVRVAELINVREMDLEEPTGYVRIRRTDTRRERRVFLFGSRDATDWGWQQLRPWIERRAELGIVRSAPLFCVAGGSTRGRPLGSPQMRTALKSYAKAAKVHGRFPMNGFRNTLAAEMYANGVSVGQVQRQLGHDTLSTTQALLERIGVVEILDDLHEYRAPWRSDEF
ncbi:MAG: integrase/recombinase XerC [Solirubrobacteraceae bacterium]